MVILASERWEYKSGGREAVVSDLGLEVRYTLRVWRDPETVVYAPRWRYGVTESLSGGPPLELISGEEVWQGEAVKRAVRCVEARVGAGRLRHLLQ